MADDFFDYLTPVVPKSRSVMGEITEEEEKKTPPVMTAGEPTFRPMELPRVVGTKVDFGDYVANQLKLGFSDIANFFLSEDERKRIYKNQPVFGYEVAQEADPATRAFGQGIRLLPSTTLPIPVRGASLFARGRPGALLGTFGAGAGSEFLGGVGGEFGPAGRVIGEFTGALTAGSAGQTLGDLLSGKLVSIASPLYKKLIGDVQDAVGPENMNKILSAANSQQMQKILQENPQLAEQLAKVEDLQKFIPGFSPNLFQATGATTVKIRGESALARRPEAISGVEAQTAASERAVKEKVAELFPVTESSYAFAGRKLDRTQTAIASLVKKADDDISKLSSQFVKTGSQELGASIRAKYEARRQATRQGFETQYSALDAEASSKNIGINPNQTQEIYNFVNQNRQAFENSPALYELVNNRFSQSETGEFATTSFSDLRSLYRRINEDLYSAGIAASQNAPGAARQQFLLGQLKDRVKAQIDTLPDDIKDKFYAINTAYDADYRQVFKKGLGGLIGAETRLGARVKDEDIIGQLTKPSNVDDFYKIFGNNAETQEYLKAGLIDNFLSRPNALNADGSVNQVALRNFLTTKEGVIKKVPALNDFLTNTDAALALHLERKNEAVRGMQALEKSALRAITKKQDFDEVFSLGSGGAFRNLDNLSAMIAAAKSDPTGRALNGIRGTMLERAFDASNPMEFFQKNEKAFRRAFGSEDFTNAKQLVEAMEMLTRKFPVSPPIQVLEGDLAQAVTGTPATGILSTIRRPIVSAPQKAAILFSRFFQAKGMEAKDEAFIELFKDPKAAAEALKNVKVLNLDKASDKAKEIAGANLEKLFAKIGVRTQVALYRAGVATAVREIGLENRPEEEVPFDFNQLTPVQ